MAGVQVEAGSELAQNIQGAVQAKLIENGWVAEENDATLSEYVTMMMVNGKDAQGVASELGTDLLMVGEDDPAVREFAQWLFDQVNLLAAPAAQDPQSAATDGVEAQQGDATSSAQDSAMDDATATSSNGIPSGPKAMRSGVAGRGGRDAKRMIGQLNSHMNRDQNLPDPLRRIKGAAGGQHGRIDSHTNRAPPRGPRGGALANGVQRMMNGRGGRQGGPMGQMNPMQQAGGMMNGLDAQQQMAFMQMMEMQASMMQQMMQGGQVPNFGQQAQQNGQGKSLFDRVDKRQPNGNFKNRQHKPARSDNGEASMEVDGDGSTKSDPFSTPCRFNDNCTNPICPFAHQSPAAPPNTTIDLNDTCSFGVACSNHKCVGRHPSPAQRTQHLKQEVDCKFFPNCNNPACPFKHPDMPPCRNGADCAVPGCKFTHSKIACRYNPCTKVHCPFKHVEGQKGVFKDKVWTPGANGGADGAPTDLGEDGNDGSGQTADRFAGFMDTGEKEELILPGKQEGQENGNTGEMQAEVEQIS